MKNKYTAENLLKEAQNMNIHCSITWQGITGYSVELYTGYTSNYVRIWYKDGETDLKKLCKKALKRLKK